MDGGIVRNGVERQARDFPGGSEVNLPASAGDEGSIPGRGTNISHAMRHSQKKKKIVNSI